MAKRKNNGSIRKRKDGRWEGRYVIGRNEKGFPISKSVLAKTKAECSEKLKQLKKSISKKPDDYSKILSFGEWIDKWYNTYCKIKLRESVQKTYEERIYKQIIPNIGSIPLKSLSRKNIQQFYSYLKDDGRLKGRDRFGDGLSDSVIRSIHAHINASLKRAVEERLIPDNPAKDCVLPSKKAKEMNILTKEEMKRLLIQAKYEGFYELLLLDLLTGIRRGELLALRWEDYNGEKGELRISKQIQVVDGKMQITQPKTKASTRLILLPESLTAVLNTYKKTCDSDWLFPSPCKKDAPRDPSAVRKALSRILERSGCRHVRFHDLRHTFAAMSLEYGVDIKTLQEMLGHASVKMTLDVYSHVTDKMRKNAADTINRAIGKADDNENMRNIVVKDADKKSKPFEPYKGKIRKRGTGCISKISDNTWEGRYSPRLPGGKRDQHVIYAHTEEECERLLAEMIEQVKAGKNVKK